MLHTRELFDGMAAPSLLEHDVMARAADTLAECEQTVTACAAGMLGEKDADTLRTAIALDLDCADVLGTTRRLLTRGAGGDRALLAAQFEACRLACERSHAQCSRHAAHHEHCRICAEATSAAEQNCQEVLRALRP